MQYRSKRRVVVRIVIDMQGAQTDSRFRGIGRYTLSLVKEMVRQKGKHEIYLALNAQLPEGLEYVRSAFIGLLPTDHIRIFDVPAIPHEGGWENEAAELIRESFLQSLEPDVILITSLVEWYWQKAVTSIKSFDHHTKVAAILYDLIPLIHPKDYLSVPEVRSAYLKKIESLKKADLLLAISESSREEGIVHLGARDSQAINISAATNPEFRPITLTLEEESALLSRLGIERPIVLYAPGGCDQRKNFDRLIAAYAALPESIRATHQLVIVSKLAPEKSLLLINLRDQYGLSQDELILPGYVTDTDLIALYSIAKLFVFPSLHEGFGLPVLEAMACGAPTIGSNRTSIPEVIGWSEALFDPFSSIAISEKMETALCDKSFRNQLRARGMAQIKNFTWKNCARKALLALETLQKEKDSGDPVPAKSMDQIHLTEAVGRISFTNRPDNVALEKAARCIVFNQDSGKRQLLLDVSELAKGDSRSGIQRVVRSLLQELLNSPPTDFSVHPIRFDNGRYWYANRLTAMLRGEPNSPEDSLVDFFQDDVYLCLDLLMGFNREIHEVHQRNALNGLSMNYIVYDLLPIQNPEWWPEEVQPEFFHWITEIAKNADRLICISEAVANDLAMQLAKHPPDRVLAGPIIGSFHLGADVLNSLPSRGVPDNAQMLLERMQRALSFLMVSTIEPRKGHAQTLAAFEQLWAQGHDINLVIVGKRGWKVDELVQKLSTHPESGHRLHWLAGVSDEFLEQIYAASDCLLSASLGEGFGLPLIEAAQHGLPILARDLPVMREVAGEHAFYFSGLQPQDLAQAVKRWLHLKECGQQPDSKSLPWLSWKQSTQQLLDALGISKPSSDTPAQVS